MPRAPAKTNPPAAEHAFKIRPTGVRVEDLDGFCVSITEDEEGDLQVDGLVGFYLSRSKLPLLLAALSAIPSR